jgi:phosphomannomutase
MDLFGTAGIRGDAVERVTPGLALDVGHAAGLLAAEDDVSTFVVGRDGRTTGPGLAAAVESGLLSAGMDVVRVGAVPTPALAFASRRRHGVMLTASHNPPTDNGIKLFVDGQEYPRDREQAVEELVESSRRPVPWDRWGQSSDDDPLPAYLDAVAAYASDHGAPLEGLPVAVDCGNGMASLATPDVLRRLGGRVVTLNANVDGHFPGRESKPTAESLSDLRTFVADGEFAFGIGHDGDADRMVVVDADGDVVHEDTVVALVAEHYVRSADARDPVVVTTPNASARIDDRVEAAGGRVERVRLGALHEGIARAEADGGDVVFAAEPWKHIHPGFGGWIDGVTSAAVVARLVAAARPTDGPLGAGVAALRDPIRERPYRKASVSCPDAAKADAMQLATDRLPDAFPEAEVNTDYGVRLTFPGAAWVLVRPSGTEPYVRVYAESDAVDELLDDALAVVRGAVEDAR